MYVCAATLILTAIIPQGPHKALEIAIAVKCGQTFIKMNQIRTK